MTLRPGVAMETTVVWGAAMASGSRSKGVEIDGFVRVAAAVPPVRVTDFEFNRAQTLALWQQADEAGCVAVFFPELGLSSYTAGDLHMDQHVLAQSLDALRWLTEEA